MYWAPSWWGFFIWDFFPTPISPYNRLFHYSLKESAINMLGTGSGGTALIFTKIPFLQMYNTLDYFVFVFFQFTIPIVIFLGVVNFKRVFKAIVNNRYNKEVLLFSFMVINFLYNAFIGAIYDGTENACFRLYIEPFLWWYVIYIVGLLWSRRWTIFKESIEVKWVSNHLEKSGISASWRNISKKTDNIWMVLYNFSYLSIFTLWSLMFLVFSILKEERILDRLLPFAGSLDLGLEGKLEVVLDYIYRISLESTIFWAAIFSIVFLILLINKIKDGFYKLWGLREYKYGLPRKIIISSVIIISGIFILCIMPVLILIGFMKSSPVYFIISILSLWIMLSLCYIAILFKKSIKIRHFFIGAAFTAVIWQVSLTLVIHNVINMVLRLKFLHLMFIGFFAFIILAFIFWLNLVLGSGIVLASKDRGASELK